MAGIITISPGHDASYPWRQIGTSAMAEQATLTGPGVAYYLSPAEKGGEPPGRWRGDGLAELGFENGQIIERQLFERLYALISECVCSVALSPLLNRSPGTTPCARRRDLSCLIELLQPLNELVELVPRLVIRQVR